MKPTVYIAYTGGTIGMKKVEGAYQPVAGYLGKRLAEMPELSSSSMPNYVLHEYPLLLDSSDMRPKNWQEIALDIAEHYETFTGFVVLHGTDTMAYSASALSFMLEGLAKPVIFTGSQIPLAEVRSDARENLITSLLIAAKEKIPEVCLYLNGQLLRGNRSTKVSASGFEAFISPNYPLLGEVGVEIEIHKEHIRSQTKRRFKVQGLADVEVAALRLFPGITAQSLKNSLRDPIQGVVLETYGSGNAPHDKQLLEVLADAVKRGVVIVNCSQCLQGSVNMQGYSTGKALEAIGVISGFDMTVEAALAKLLYLFSKGKSPNEVSMLMQENLRGELSVAD